MDSIALQIIAVERLSGKKASRTPGLDGKTLLKSPESKLDTLKELQTYLKLLKALPSKRVNLPKIKTEKRPQSLPPITVRAAQMLVALILDPIVESQSDAYSFGFRKGRNALIAIGVIQKSLQNKFTKQAKHQRDIRV